MQRIAVWTVNTNAVLCFFPALQNWEKLLHSWIYTHSRFGNIRPVCHKSKQILIVWERHRKSVSSCNLFVNTASDEIVNHLLIMTNKLPKKKRKNRLFRVLKCISFFTTTYKCKTTYINRLGLYWRGNLPIV